MAAKNISIKCSDESVRVPVRILNDGKYQPVVKGYEYKVLYAQTFEQKTAEPIRSERTL